MLKIVDIGSDKDFELLILRRGGVSEKALMEVTQSLNKFQITVKAKQHNEFKPETEKLEGPGQFLRHYSPNIESYLYSGKFESD